jgi:hypothetical protein
MAATAKAANATRKAPVATREMRILSFLDCYATQKAFSYLKITKNIYHWIFDSFKLDEETFNDSKTQSPSGEER